ncbi:substrate-binding domain-containing protein [Hoeflea sp. G2-23]|uniref:Substrate-binding domain-containing protein n=1 Tax=Hoeflea algicola TaxID=2983763 RepID=A0ABT3ZEE1_9HYPH|nr:substrate-binding domain-containing protein [Hoeflea algicola]MCY0149659.1 substrate-binding domain-containing protein [Hoeflea algicola]
MRILKLAIAATVGVMTAFAAQAQDKPKIGMPMTTLNDAFWVDYVNFAKSAAEAYGYELVVTDAQSREDKQLSDIETLVNAGVKGMILTPLSEPLGIQAIELLDRAGVPVVVTDTFPGVEVGYKPNYLAFIKLDDETAGYNVAKHLIEKDGVKNLVGIGGVPGISTSEARNDGMKKAAAEHSEVTVLDVQYTDWTLAKGQSVMEDFLTRFDNIDGVWGAGSDPLLGAIVSIENAGRSGIKLAGIDITEAAIDSLEEDKLSMLAGGHWVMGGYGVTIIHDYLNGHETDQPVYEMSLYYLTKDGIDDYRSAIIDPLAEGKSLVDWKAISKTSDSSVNHADVFQVIAP